MLDLLFSSLFAQATEVAAQATKVAPSYVLPMLGLLLVSTVPPFLLGYFLAKSLRVPDYANRVGFIFLTIGLGIGILIACLPAVGLATPKFGIDLKGGVILVYEIDKDDTDAARTELGTEGQVQVDDLVASLNERLNPGGINEIQVRGFGENQVEIVVPDVGPEEVEAIKRKVEESGRLEFLIVANDPLVDDAINIVKSEANLSREKLVRNAKGEVVGKWARVLWNENKKTKQKELDVFYSDALFRNAETGELLEEARTMNQPAFEAFLKEKGIEFVDVLMVVDPNKDNWVEGTHLAQATISTNQFGDYVVHFTMTSEGATRMANLTGNNLSDPQRNRMRFLGIVLDGNLRSAPSVNSTISASGEITGRFSLADVKFLVDVLKFGRLPAVLQREPINENQISPLLGMDTINKGRVSIIVSLVAVFAFMLFYYRFAGAVACFALAVNLLLVVALMIVMRAAFTLPGLAGMVLTVGMSVDANVLIYERMREELSRGAALRMAIRNGFARAMSSIIDGNVTAIITAVVLYVIGSEQLKGFAVTLILGIIISMYTAIFCSRIIFEIAERRRFITTLTMMDFWGKTNINFIRLFMPMTAISLVVIAIGMVALVARGQTMLDIDFLGGTSVELLLREPMTENEVREKVAARFESEKVDYTVTSINRVANRADGTIFKVDTSIQDVVQLQTALEEIFRASDGTSLLAINSVEAMKVASTEPFGLGAIKNDKLPVSDKKGGDKNSPEAKPEEKKPEAPVTETKAEEAKSEAKSADEAKPEEKKVEEAKPTEEPKPEEKQGDEPAAAKPGDSVFRLDVPADLLALQDDVKKDESKPEEKKADEQPAVTPSTEATPTAPVAPATPAIVAPAAPTEFSQIELTFTYPINATTLRLVVTDAVKMLSGQGNLQRQAWDTELAHPTWLELVPNEQAVDWNPDSSKKFSSWKVKLACSTADAEQIAASVKKNMGNATVWQSSSKIGGKVAGKTRTQAVWAIFASLLGIVAYIWVRFHRLAYGIAAVIALVHDVLITVGFLALSAWLAPFLGFAQVEEFKISLTVIAAILTLIGYSLNDTIVTFDRMREIKGKSPELTSDMINRAINETLSRTFLTATTTFMVVTILYFMGGSGIHGFAFAMLIGVIAGTYSTVFIAAPVLLWMGARDLTDVNEKPSKTEKAKVG